jgi:hypothetical protein
MLSHCVAIFFNCAATASLAVLLQVLRQPFPLAAAGAVQPLQQQQQQQPWQQWQQQRGLLGVKKHINYQDHNQKKPPKYKIKTPS